MATLTEKSPVYPSPDRAAEFEGIVKRNQRRLIAIGYRMLGNLEEARDLAQETFIRLWQTHLWPEEASGTFALLSRILINLCIDRLRWRKRHQLFFWRTENAESDPSSFDDLEQGVSNGELTTLMESATARLKPKQKAAFVLRDVEGYSVRETAVLLGCSENNVLVNLHLARKNLRKWLTPYLKE